MLTLDGDGLRIGLGRIGNPLQFVEREHAAGAQALAAGDVGGGHVVRHAIDPGRLRAAAVELGKAAPDGEVDVLQQVLLLVRIGLEGPRQALQRRAKRLRRAHIALVLLRTDLVAPVHDPLDHGAGGLLQRAAATAPGTSSGPGSPPGSAGPR